MARKKKVKIKITSNGMLVTFGYFVRTPAIVELYPNQIAILKSTGTEYEVLYDPNSEDESEKPAEMRKPVTMFRGGIVKPRNSRPVVANKNAEKAAAETKGKMKKRQKKQKKSPFTSGARFG